MKFWKVIKGVVKVIFRDFYKGVPDTSRLNYGVVMLISKVVGPMDIRQFRPIIVINVIFHVLAKAHAIKEAPIVARITHQN